MVVFAGSLAFERVGGIVRNLVRPHGAYLSIVFGKSNQRLEQPASDNSPAATLSITVTTSGSGASKSHPFKPRKTSIAKKAALLFPSRYGWLRAKPKP
jgi:hypothetical protein